MQDILQSLTAQFTKYLPGVLGALVLLFIGWLMARSIGALVTRLMQSFKLETRLQNPKSAHQLEKGIGRFVYYILMVVVLLVVLESLGLHNVLEPLKNMANEFFVFLPNLVAALLIGFAGYMIASICSELVSMFGKALDGFSESVGVSQQIQFSKIIKQLVFIFVFVPILIAALDALKVEAISAPASKMLDTVMNTIPNIIGAALVLAVFYIGGRFLMSLLKDLLKNMGADELTRRLNLHTMIGEKQSLAELISQVAFFFLMFGGVLTAVEKLGFAQLSQTLQQLFELSGQIFFGMIIMVLGNFISLIIHRTLSQSKENSFLADIARVAIIGLFLAIALRTMGIANDIVNLAFGLTLGSVAVAIALSFGLGGREAAGKQMEYILKRFRGREES